MGIQTFALVALLVGISGLRTAHSAQPAPAAPACLHGSSEESAQRTRREQARAVAQAINQSENAGRLVPGTPAGYKLFDQLTDLPPVPPGFSVQLNTDGNTYGFVIKDTLDPCRYAIFSDQDGFLYDTITTGRLTLNALLDRASAYAVDVIDRLSSVVVEEHYQQKRADKQRMLRSDFLLVKFPGATLWQPFRQVLEVNGKSVRRPNEGARLLELFTTPPPDLLTRIEQIAREGARHNLTEIGTLNNPLLAIAFLQAEYRSRFRFTDVPAAFGPEIRGIQFEEETKPTILKYGKNEDLFSSGRMWIEEDTGRVVKTELVATLPESHTVARVETDFGFDQELDINVPREMRDSYPWKGFEGVARYQRFRRFQVHTEQSFRK